MLTVPSRSAFTIETDRILISPIGSGDAVDMWRAIDDSRDHLSRWLTWVPFVQDLSASTRYVESSASDWDQGKCCIFVLRTLHSGEFLGVVGLEDLSHTDRSCNLGYWLKEESVGNGYMVEAIRPIMDWAFNKVGVHRIQALIASHNHSSFSVVWNLGFYSEGIARASKYLGGHWVDCLVFSRLASDPPPEEV